jgi:hypothetical protein
VYNTATTTTTTTSRQVVSGWIMYKTAGYTNKKVDSKCGAQPPEAFTELFEEIAQEQPDA